MKEQEDTIRAKEETNKAKDEVIKAKEQAIAELRAAVEGKTTSLAAASERQGQLESELSALRMLASGANSEQRQQLQALMQKDEIIRKLEARLADAVQALEAARNREASEVIQIREGSLGQSSADRDKLVSETNRERSTFEMQIRKLAEEKNEELTLRELKIKGLEEEVEHWKEQAESQIVKKVVKRGKNEEPKYIMAAPKVERLIKTAVEIRYEQDPFILAENEKMAKELAISLV